VGTATVASLDISFAVVRVDPEWLEVGPPGDDPGQGLDGVTVQSVRPTAEDALAEPSGSTS
jgi:hypothetical protein